MKYLIILLISVSSLSQEKKLNKVTALGDYEKILEEQGIHFESKDTPFLLNYLNQRIETNNLSLQDKNDSNYKRAKSEKPFLEHAIEVLVNSKNPVEGYNLALRALYTLDADYLDNDEYKGWGKVKMLEKLFNAQAKFDIRDNRNPTETMSRKSLKKAALNLKKSSESYYQISELKALSPMDLSELDISENHPKWFQNSAKVDGKKHWEYIESWINKKVSKKFNKKNKESISYDLKKANKILLFDGMKSNDSSPKFKTKDLYGMKWKLKMGEEIHTESMFNRLYVLLGGKFNDPVYSQSVTKNNLSVLILDKEEDADGCKKVSNLEKLQDCFLNGYFKFNMSGYVHSYGDITLENIEETFNPQNSYEAKKLKKYVGRKFLILKEASLEYRDYPITKSGPSTLSNLDSPSDRVHRGLSVFHSWIQNVDLRDANTRSYILKDFMGKDTYVEADHDLGASMGFVSKIGSVNHFKTKDNFLMVSKRGKELAILDIRYHFPKSWDKATYADMKWMLDKIQKLKLEDLRWAISSSALPIFVEDIIYNKMLSRINSIFEVFNMSTFPEEKRSNISLPINEETAKSFNISDEDYAESIEQYKSLMNSTDSLSRNNKISECYESFWVNLLEKANHPSGISRKVTRMNDSEPLPPCSLE